MTNARRSLVILLLIAAGAGALLAFKPSQDPDLWWHLATGRLALATRSTLPTDPFSFSFYGAPWPQKDVVAAVGIWLAFAAAGFVGLWLVSALAAASMVLGWRQLTARSWPILVALLVTLPLLQWTQRPNLLSLALFPTVLALLERRRWAWLVLVSWIWIVLHRAALLGYALILGRALQQLVARLCARWPRLTLVAGAPPTPRELALAWLAAVAAPLVGLCNPSGRAAFTTSVALVESDVQRIYIAEWRRLGLAALEGWAGVLFAVAALLVVARLVVAVRRRQRAPVDLWHLALLVLFAVMATQRLRWLPYLPLACALVLLLLVDEAVARLPPPTLKRLPLTPALVLLLLAACLAARRGAPWTLGEDRGVEPSDAVDFARTHQLDGPVISSFEFGGYLIYRGLPVLVDGRLEQLYPPAFVATCIQAERNPAFLAQLPLDDVTWAIGSNGDARFTHRYLYRDPRWMMVYWSDAASVYVLRAAHPELASLAFVAIDPAAPERSAAEAARSPDDRYVAAARAELQRMLTASPTSLRANSALAIWFHLTGHAAERDVVMRVLHAVAADHPAVRELDRRFGSKP